MTVVRFSKHTAHECCKSLVENGIVAILENIYTNVDSFQAVAKLDTTRPSDSRAAAYNKLQLLFGMLTAVTEWNIFLRELRKLIITDLEDMRIAKQYIPDMFIKAVLDSAVLGLPASFIRSPALPSIGIELVDPGLLALLLSQIRYDARMKAAAKQPVDDCINWHNNLYTVSGLHIKLTANERRCACFDRGKYVKVTTVHRSSTPPTTSVTYSVVKATGRPVNPQLPSYFAVTNKQRETMTAEECI